jgi:hypothetical protein
MKGGRSLAQAFRVAARPSLDLSLLQRTPGVVLHGGGAEATVFDGNLRAGNGPSGSAAFMTFQYCRLHGDIASIWP